MTDIENCPLSFRCHQSWNELERTENKRVRFCEHCQSQVHLVTTRRQLDKAIEEEQCIALKFVDDGQMIVGGAGLPYEVDGLKEELLLGVPLRDTDDDDQDEI